MSPSPQLAPAGSSTYNSDTMYVGDGTWDSSRNTFLLPNLVGLNFATMQYNGMGNRFLDMPGYHNLIMGHGIIAAITFLGLIPAAIFVAHFYNRDARLALRTHISLQILTVMLSTVVFVLGWFAVGPARSLTNPHHGIGLAIYVLILVQAIGGAIIHRSEKKKERIRIPLKLFLHQWMGRAIALLGFAQVVLGLTLYGSPKALFILYALWGFLLLMLYMGLSFRYRPQIGFYDGASSYYTGYSGGRTTTVTEDRRSRRHGSNLGRLAAGGAAGAGIAALRHRSRSRRRSRSRDEVISSRHSSRSPRRSSSIGRTTYDEKHDPKENTWRNRLLGAGAGIGAMAAIRGLFNRRKGHELGSETGSYGPPVAGASTITQTDVSRVEEGLAPSSPENHRIRRNRTSVAPAAAAAAAGTSLGSPSRRASLRRRSGGSIYSDSDSEFSDDAPRRNFGIKEGIAVLGVGGFFKHKMDQRRRRKEDARAEVFRAQEIEKERIARMNSERRRYTGDGTPGRPRRGGRRGSLTETTDISDDTHLTGSTPGLSLVRPSQGSASAVPGAAPPESSRTDLIDPAPVPAAATPPRVPRVGHVESGSEEYFSSGGRPHRRHHLRPEPSSPLPSSLVAGGGAGAGALTTAAATAGAAAANRDTSRQRSSAGASVNSPPVSVKVKMHEDGRHVTLRRLNEEEAAAERERRQRERQRRNRGGSVSSLSNENDERWRRTATVGGASQQQIEAAAPPSSVNAPGSPAGPPPGAGVFDSGQGLPPPPPIPAAGGSAMGSSPAGTGTEMSRTSAYESNRKRRRMERANKLKAAAGTGSRVEFT